MNDPCCRENEEEAAYWASFRDEDRARWQRQYLFARWIAAIACFMMFAIMLWLSLK